MTTGILGNFLQPQNMDNLALAFNSLRTRPDPNLAQFIQNRQSQRLAETNRQKAMEFFQGKPNGAAYIAALGSGGDPSGLIQSYISNQNARATAGSNTVDRNRTVALLRQKADEGDARAGQLADLIEAGGNAGQLLGIYYQGEVSGQAVQSTKDLGRGLSKVVYKNSDVKYFNNGVELQGAAIEQAIEAEKAYDLEQSRLKKQAQSRGGARGKDIAELEKTVSDIGIIRAQIRPVAIALYNHAGMAAATGTIGGNKPADLLSGNPIVLPDGSTGGSPREFAGLHDQLMGQIFLSAFDKLKGGGQITEIEGEKATQAASNLSRKLNPPEYRKALERFVNSLLELQKEKQAQYERALADESTPIAPAIEFQPDLD